MAEDFVLGLFRRVWRSARYFQGGKPPQKSVRSGSSRRLPPHLIPEGHQPSKLVKMTPMHQMPAADPEPERLDETQVKTIQTKANNELAPAMPVRTRMPSRAVPCGPRAQHEPRR